MFELQASDAGRALPVFQGRAHCVPLHAVIEGNSPGRTFVDDVRDPGVLKEMRERLPRARTIPQIFIDGEHVGGYDDLKFRFG